MELQGLTAAAAKIIYLKASLRLSSLTEDEVLRWRGGAWRIAEEIISKYRERLKANRQIAMFAMENITPEHISSELVRRRPDLAQYWQDEVFFRRLREEREALLSFLESSD